MNTQNLLIEDVCIVLSYIAVFSYYYTIIIMQCFNTHTHMMKQYPKAYKTHATLCSLWNILIRSVSFNITFQQLLRI